MSQPSDVQVAMPLFASQAPEASSVLKAWKKLFDSNVRHSRAQTVDVYEVDGVEVMAIDAPVAVPKQEITEALRSSWMWQRPPEPALNHHAHAIVTATGDAPVLTRATALTRVCAAMLEAAGGVALYWGAAHQVHAPELVRDFAQKLDQATPLWVGVTIYADTKAGPFSALTHGLEALGHREFEVIDSVKPLGELRLALLDFASYVLREGPVLKHGQTIGPDAATKWSITHRPSQLVDGQNVIALGM
jgi:Domain of unknown function (DUF4261)